MEPTKKHWGWDTEQSWDTAEESRCARQKMPHRGVKGVKDPG